MRRQYIFIVTIFTFSWLVLSSGCSSKDATEGTLTIQVVDYMTNAPVTGEMVYISTSYQNLKDHVWINKLYTDANGKAFFHDLAPILTYYDTEHWENYGAEQVYAGIDENVILYVNTPPPQKTGVMHKKNS